MAKHKRKRTKKVSKGLRPSISAATIRDTRAAVHPIDKMMNKLNAWMRGKKGFITIENPNTAETDKRYIKVTFERYFGGAYKDIKSRNKPAEDKNRIEL